MHDRRDQVIAAQQRTAPTTNDGWQAALRPTTFDDYIGQKEIIESLRLSVRAARRGDWTLDHFLFSGPPGVGKTSLAQVIARELDQKLVVTSAPSLSHRGELAALLTSLLPGNVLFVDEIHRLPVVLQEILYTAMEDFAITLTDASGRGGSITLPLTPFTLLGATTRVGQLTPPLLDRFGFHWQLRHYDIADLMVIIARAAALLRIAIDHAGCLEIARRSRGTPRIANRLLRRVRDLAIMATEERGMHAIHALRHGRRSDVICMIDGPLAAAALTRLKVDDAGLDGVDRDYMKVIAAHDGRAVGIEAIAASLHAPRTTLEDVVEPLLLRLGMVVRTSRGRMLTESGRRHLDSSNLAGPSRALSVLPK